MAIIDIIILIPLLWGAYKGFTKGLIMTFVSLIAFILGIIIGFKLMHWGVSFLTPHINNKFVPLLSFLLIFILVVFGVHLLGRFLKTVLKLTMLSWLDKLGGAVLGALFWAIGLSTLLWLFQHAEFELPSNLTENAIIFPYFIKFGPVLMEGIANILPFTGDLFKKITTLFN